MTDYKAARIAMVDRQVRPSDVTSFPIIEAMLSTPRERFAPAAQKPVAYADAALAQGAGRTALAPRVFAKMLDGANIGPDDLVLDIAPGLGYSTAVIARIAAAVIAVEPDPDLAAAAGDALSALEIDNALVMQGDAAAGDAEHGPYDAIFVNGAVAAPPAALMAQLKDGGRLVAVHADAGAGRAVAFMRVAGQMVERRLFDAAAPFAPGFEPVDEFAF